MGKIIKLKQSDIEKIVTKVLKEQEEFDDIETKKQPEEFSTEEEELTLGMDKDGNYYVLSNVGDGEPKIVAKTK
jgi:hypothetical protein